MFGKDKNEKLFLKALKKGNAEKQYILAREFAESRDEKDFIRACALFEAAANSGHKDAQYALGLLYYDGKRRERDWELAAAWFKLAAVNDVTEAYKYLGEIYRYGFYGAKEDVEKAVESYLKFYEVCAEDEKAEIENNLGGCYYILDDEENALRWARRCAKRGDKDALGAYGAMLSDFKRYDEAFETLTRAAELGDSYSVYLLGECYFYGRGVSKDAKKAEELWQKAAESGIGEAVEDLKKHFKK